MKKPFWLRMYELLLGESKGTETTADEMMVAITTINMQDKLELKRETGKGGWWDKEVCSTRELQALLDEQLLKDEVDWIDVMNFAGMLYIRQEQDKHDVS